VLAQHERPLMATNPVDWAAFATAAFAAVVALYRTSSSTGERRHESDTSAILATNKQLLDERRQLVEQVGRIDQQVSNSHKSNLRDDISDALEKLDSLGDAVLTLSTNMVQHGVEIGAIRTQLTTVEQKVAERA
jgi:hypothetical protein